MDHPSFSPPPGAAGTSVLGLSGLPLSTAMGSASAVLGTVAASASMVGVASWKNPMVGVDWYKRLWKFWGKVV